MFFPQSPDTTAILSTTKSLPVTNEPSKSWANWDKSTTEKDPKWVPESTDEESTVEYSLQHAEEMLIAAVPGEEFPNPSRKGGRNDLFSHAANAQISFHLYIEEKYRSMTPNSSLGHIRLPDVNGSPN